MINGIIKHNNDHFYCFHSKQTDADVLIFVTVKLMITVKTWTIILLLSDSMFVFFSGSSHCDKQLLIT